MARTLSASEAKASFEEIVKGLAKQHLRLRFRRTFGTGELMDATMLVKGTTAAPLGRPVSNLLQELPPHLIVTRLTGTVDAIGGESLKTPGTLTVGELLSAEEVEQALIVQGRKARIFVYFDPTESQVFAAREATPEVDAKPKKAPVRGWSKATPTKKTSRTKRAGGRR
ncbi:MAG: hypothetical protein ACO1SV_21365 [Fimbriimonas sp.]